MTQKEATEYAINLAKKANENEIRPNPFVGAVVLDHQGQLIGEGYHQKYGAAHAEVNAINEVKDKVEFLSILGEYNKSKQE